MLFINTNLKQPTLKRTFNKLRHKSVYTILTTSTYTMYVHVCIFNSLVRSIENEETIIFFRVTRHHSGVYVCGTTYDQGLVTEDSISVQIHCKLTYSKVE